MLLQAGPGLCIVHLVDVLFIFHLYTKQTFCNQRLKLITYFGAETKSDLSHNGGDNS